MTQAARRYLLDANVFIQAFRQYYAFDLVPGFWELLAEQAAAGQVSSIDRVRKEVARGKDELWRWMVKSLPKTCFKATRSAKVAAAFGSAQTWVNGARFKNHAKADFASSTDGWLPAYARVHGFVVVTQEQRNPVMRVKVPLPEVCDELNVECVDCFQMLRELGVSFHLQR